MIVKTISFTQDPVDIIYIAAKNCVSKQMTYNAYSIPYKEKKRLIEKVYNAGHHSVLEHVIFTFGISGISRACSHQLVRHRLASYAQQSQRYAKMDQADFIIPQSIQDHKLYSIKYGHVLKRISDFYLELLEAGIPNEDARFILPNACQTNIVMTMNLRELIETSKVRLCGKAQWEIQELFGLIRTEVLKKESFLGTFLKSKCKYLGYCPEEVSCGRMPVKKDVA